MLGLRKMEIGKVLEVISKVGEDGNKESFYWCLLPEIFHCNFVGTGFDSQRWKYGGGVELARRAIDF